ncbi:MAG: Nif3-like dinuclear metal center hexameric protein [Bacteroidia bacterium]|jgi:dinuclear metal center YbgI/SA1388 family protein|nr:Nif3-like dinuclear metal center hexameric protein [Bacteroidia bacterium]
MKLAHLLDYLESIAPPAFQESYDNSRLLTGHPGMEITAALCTLDCTEAVVDEAIATDCNLIVAHHPIIFGGLKQLTGRNYVERTIIKAIKHDIAIYAIHTNLDNVHTGVNARIAERLGLTNTRILQPKAGLLAKLVTFCPTAQAPALRQALFAAGAGQIGNYDSCSFSTPGQGTFRGNEASTPFVGEKGQLHTEAEERIEVVYPRHLAGRIIKALLAAHPYEEVAYDQIPLDNAWAQTGSGMVGELPQAMPPQAFLAHLKTTMQATVIRFTPVEKPIKRVAVCGGAGSFLLGAAKASGADAYVTADYKYHEFFDAENQLMIADIGHYESEQFTKQLLADRITEKFTTFAVRLSGVNTNPISYYT